MKKKLSAQRLRQRNKLLPVIFCLFVAAIAFMSVGFASYGQTLDLGGQVTIAAPGRENKIYVLDAVYTGGKNVISSSGSSTPYPSFTEDTVSLNTAFRHVGLFSTSHEARYAITIKNDTYVDYKISAEWSPYTTNNWGRRISNYINYRFEGFENGDILHAGDSLTMNLIVSHNTNIFGGTIQTLNGDIKFNYE